MTAESEQPEQDEPIPDFETVLEGLSNPDVLAVLDLTLLELEKRLLRYARVGAEILEMADEGLVLSARAAARLAQAQSSAQHTLSHLQLVGVGDWRPRSTQPSWSDDPRVVSDEADGQAD
jgi:predicted nucleotidyltransferase